MIQKTDVIKLISIADDMRSCTVTKNGEPFFYDRHTPIESDAAATLLYVALKMSLNSHNVSMLGDPPQDAWKSYEVDHNTLAAIEAYTSIEAYDKSREE